MAKLSVPQGQELLHWNHSRSISSFLLWGNFHDPELARMIPNVKFSGIKKANRAIKLSQRKRESVYEPIEVKLGDVLRWNYTKEVGVVVGFDSEGGIVVKLDDGTKIIFENDPKLFVKVE